MKPYWRKWTPLPSGGISISDIWRLYVALWNVESHFRFFLYKDLVRFFVDQVIFIFFREYNL